MPTCCFVLRKLSLVVIVVLPISVNQNIDKR